MHHGVRIQDGRAGGRRRAVVERRIRQLEIERVALAKETDEPSRERLADLDEELANLREQATAMKAHWQAEKDTITAIRSVKQELEAAKAEIEVGLN